MIYKAVSGQNLFNVLRSAKIFARGATDGKATFYFNDRFITVTPLSNLAAIFAAYYNTALGIGPCEYGGDDEVEIRESVLTSWSAAEREWAAKALSALQKA